MGHWLVSYPVTRYALGTFAVYSFGSTKRERFRELGYNHIPIGPGRQTSYSLWMAVHRRAAEVSRESASAQATPHQKRRMKIRDDVEPWHSVVYDWNVGRVVPQGGGERSTKSIVGHKPQICIGIRFWFAL